MTQSPSSGGDAYRRAGVDIDAGENLVARIKSAVKSTARPGADSAIGGFGGIFDLKAAGLKDPLLVAGADGVGTKLKIAIATGNHETIGIDLVAMCVNDVLAQGALPLFFLDYYATSKLSPEDAAMVVSGIAEGCRQANCALIGGETAEMPGLYRDGDYDLAGFCVGAVEREHLLPRACQDGDILIGLPSSGAHSNGYSLIRKIVSDRGCQWQDKAPFAPEQTLGAAFLEPTRIYVKSMAPVLTHPGLRGFAHITGGGLTDNVPRILGDGLAPVFDEAALDLPPLFQWLKEAGHISNDDMRRTFNCGIGGVVVTAPDAADDVMARLHEHGETPRVIGEVKKV